MITLLLVDDHVLLREGLRSVLEQRPGIKVVGEASDGREALQLMTKLSPQIVVMDIGMRTMNGIEATRRIRAQYPKVKVVALSTHSDQRYVLEMLRAGASGYVLKEAAAEELYRAIKAVRRNLKYLSADVAGIIVDSYVDATQADSATPYSELTSRERQVLQFIAEGHSSPQISQQLHLSVSTVDAHRRNIMKKLDLHSIAALTKYAVREGLTPAK